MSEPVSQRINIAELMQSSCVKFGTSGARGLATDMSDRVCYAYTLAFLHFLEEHGETGQEKCVAVAGDFRPSTPRIMAAVALASEHAGYAVVNCGFIPTPAIALYGLTRNIPAIMVTGSHIPDDRNGIKFYKPTGELMKEDESGMTERHVDLPAERFDSGGMLTAPFPLPPADEAAARQYIKRYIDFFPAKCLAGRRIGMYQHSSVARDLLPEVLEALGAEVTCLGRSEHFIPVDTEAIRPEDIRLAAQWSREQNFDCIVSTDGDGDRPLVSDEHGNWLRGDVAGILVARFLGATSVVTPVSSNTALEKCGWFTDTRRTRIGSPYVIAAMQQAEQDGIKTVVGYEANGGFLTQNDIALNNRSLSALPTRDALIVPLAILQLARESSTSVSGLLSELPQRYTTSDRIKDFPTELSQARLAPLRTGNTADNLLAAHSLFGELFGEIESMDSTDGVRITFKSGEIAHLRPSGNAPELRCYTEADSPQRAEEMTRDCISMLSGWREL